ncbi:MAG TPA: FAD:protein FMN transferase [Propionicimonas sp.]|nr:FAD:protein FMN transferase [Propionicimonas sp.]HRA05997.1 FAD:protein FMN transferase [Propionicimonas sp.]
MVAVDRWDALGSWCEVLTLDAADLPDVAELARTRVAAVDAACSRFRADSELSGLVGGRPQTVSPVLGQALAAALRAAEFSAGLVDPTVGSRGPRRAGTDWRSVRFDPDSRRLLLPEETELDLGAIGKAWAADWIAQACTEELGVGVLVNLGGDIAVRGPVPPGGWQVEIDDEDVAPPGRPVIAVGWPGGLATSASDLGSAGAGAELGQGASARPVLDPTTGMPADPAWRRVTVAARSCERANAASLAAIILGDSAPRWLTQRELPARLVHRDGMVVQTNGWP